MAVSFRQAGKLIEYTAVADTEYHVPVAVGSLIGITRKSAVLNTIVTMNGGELLAKKLPSTRIRANLVLILAPAV